MLKWRFRQNGEVDNVVPVSPKTPKVEPVSLRQAINDSVNQYLSLSGEENESLSDPASPRLKQMARNGSNSTSDDKLSASNDPIPSPAPLTPSPLDPQTPSVAPHERLNPPMRSAPRRGSRRRPSRNRTPMVNQVGSPAAPQLAKSAQSYESLSTSAKSSNSASLGVNHEPLDVFERLNEGANLEGWRTEQTPNNSAAPTPSATPLETELT